MTTIKEIPAFQLATIYRVMLKRIAKGYTAEQLTFLIGAPENHIQDIEALEKPFYSLDDLERIARALEESNLQTLFSPINNEAMLKIAVSREYAEGNFIHSFYLLDKDNNQKELFRLQEEEFPEFDDLLRSDEILDTVSDTVDVMIRSGYFYEPKLPYEIFSTINTLQPEPLNSCYIQFALQRFCADDDQGRLRIVGSAEKPYRYEAC